MEDLFRGEKGLSPRFPRLTHATAGGPRRESSWNIGSIGAWFPRHFGCNSDGLVILLTRGKKLRQQRDTDKARHRSGEWVAVTTGPRLYQPPSDGESANRDYAEIPRQLASR